MAKIHVGVLRGGPSSEYDISLKTGGAVLRFLPTDKYDPHDVLITKEGEWHLDGMSSSPERVGMTIDVAFNALHGEYGEDGTIQTILDNLNLPYTGSGRLASALAMNKPLASEILRKAGFRVPVAVLAEAEEEPEIVAQRVFLKISPPWVVKPADRGSSVGLSFVKTFSNLAEAIKRAADYSKRVLIEQFVKGREATVGVVEGFRGERHYVLPAIEIRTPGNKQVWEYDDKYSGATLELCPGPFGDEDKVHLAQLASLAHQTLGLRHYSRTDFIVTTTGPYLLEVNTLPGMTSESLMPKALEAVGVRYPDFLDHVVTLALKK